MNRSFVIRHGKFGRARIRLSQKYPNAVWFGVARGNWFGRAYRKVIAGSFRLEIQFNRVGLEALGVRTPRDFPKLTGPVLEKMRFFRIDWRKLKRYVYRRYANPKFLLAGARDRRGNLWRLLNLLRRGGVKNSQRFLVPLPVNDEIRVAVQKWSKAWERAGRKKRKGESP